MLHDIFETLCFKESFTEELELSGTSAAVPIECKSQEW